MADTFSKKEREKKKRKKQEAKVARREQKKTDPGEKSNQIMFVDEFGNFTETPPDPKQKTKIRKEDIRVSVPKDDELEAEDSLRTGRVKFFNDEKGYGFIVDDRTGESYFAHANNLIEEIVEGNQVEFELGSGPKGPMAIGVKLQKKE
jgi:cold shock CspA family protein